MSVSPIRSVSLLLALLLSMGSVARADPPVRITPRDAVTTALKHNLGLKYARLAPELTRAPERVAEAGFDTTLYGALTGSGDGDGFHYRLKPGFDVRLDAELGVRRTFQTGTRLDVSLGGLLGFGGNGTTAGRMTYQGGLALTVRHPLLLGGSREVNRAGITTARLERNAAHQDLRRKVELTAAEVLKAYWDLHAAIASLKVQEVALAQSRTTLAETRELIKAQKIPASEAVEAEHQVKREERATLLARQAVDNQRDKLARLMGLTGKRSLVTPGYVTSEAQGLPAPSKALRALLALSLQKRGDYRALQINQKTSQTEMKVARHALLPTLDFVGSVGVYGHNNPHAAATDPTLGLAQGRVAWSAGLVLEIPLSHREAKAKRDIAVLKLRRTAVSIAEKELLIAEELKVAIRGVQAAEALVALASKAVVVAETKLKNEMERYRSGKTPARLVALVRADVVSEKLALEQAHATLRKARVDLWATTGTLLQKIGASAGAQGSR